MRLAIDTNVPISALVADSKTRELILESYHELYSPDYLKIEVQKHEDESIEKSGLTDSHFKSLWALLFEEIEVVPRGEYCGELEKSKGIMEDIDVKDAPFLARALEKTQKSGPTTNTFKNRTWSPCSRLPNSLGEIIGIPTKTRKPPGFSGHGTGIRNAAELGKRKACSRASANPLVRIKKFNNGQKKG